MLLFRKCILQVKSHTPYFIIIGANDGLDGSYKLLDNWEGILIEPVLEYYELLKANCNNSHKFEQVAIGNYNGDGIIYKADIEKARNFNMINDPNYLKYVSSFDKEHVFAHCPWLKQNNDIIEEKVKVVTFDRIIQKYKISHVDYLQIDAEGADYDILMSINRCELPSILMIEHKHMTYTQMIKTKTMLLSYGYIVETFEEDFLAFEYDVIIL